MFNHKLDVAQCPHHCIRQTCAHQTLESQIRVSNECSLKFRDTLEIDKVD